MSGGGKSKSTEVPETEAERALAEVSAGKWKIYQEQFLPLENQFMRTVDSMGRENVQKQTANLALSQAQNQTGGLQSQMNQQLFAQGLDPSQGVYQGKSMVLNHAIAKTRQNAYNNGMMAAKNAYIQGLGNVVAMGSGQDTAAFNGFGELANKAAQNAMDNARREFDKQTAADQMKGQILGAATSYGINAYFKPTVLNPVQLDTSIPNNAPSNQVSLSGGSGYDFNDVAKGFGVSRYPNNTMGFR